MKKTIALVLCAVLVLSAFSACGGQHSAGHFELQSEAVIDVDTNASEQLAEAYKGIKERPRFIVGADVISVTAGDTFTVYYSLQDAKKVASFDLTVEYDTENLEIVKTTPAKIESLYFEENKIDGGLLFFAYTARTIDIDDAVLLEVTFRVKKDAAVKEVFANLKVDTMEIGVDRDGTTVVQIPDVNVDFALPVR